MFNVGKSLFTKKNVGDSLRLIKMSFSCPCLLLARRGALALLLLWCSLCGRKQAPGAGEGKDKVHPLFWVAGNSQRRVLLRWLLSSDAESAWDVERPLATWTQGHPSTRALCSVPRMHYIRLSNVLWVTAYFLGKIFFQNRLSSWPCSLKTCYVDFRVKIMLNDKAYFSYFNKELELCEITANVSLFVAKTCFSDQ